MNAFTRCFPSAALLLSVSAVMPARGAGGPLCPPRRPARTGEIVLLDLPANVRAAPGGRVIHVAKRSADSFWKGQARVLAVRGQWYEVEPTAPHEGGAEWPRRGFVHESNVQPVCVVTGDDDIPRGPDGRPLVRRSQEEAELRLEAFGHRAPPIEAREDASQYLFETKSPEFPLAYLVDSSDMGGGDLVAFGPRGFVSWESGAGKRFRGGILLEVRRDGDIRMGNQLGCLVIWLTLRVDRQGIRLAGSTFPGDESSKTIRNEPIASERPGECSIQYPGGRRVPLGPGEKLQLLRVTPDARRIVVRRLSDGSTGLFDPEAASACFENQHCAA